MGKINGLPGDSGGERPSPYSEDTDVGTMRLVRKLIRRKDWEIPDHAWAEIPERLVKLALDSKTAHRSVIGASNVLLGMSRAATQRDSADVRIINQHLSIAAQPPEVPEDTPPEQLAYIESVRPGDQEETAKVLARFGLLPDYLKQLEGNRHEGNGHKNGHSNGSP